MGNCKRSTYVVYIVIVIVGVESKGELLPLASSISTTNNRFDSQTKPITASITLHERLTTPR
ncbi:MAG TPA: hypothetical protein VGA96_11065 [Fibrella sp.]